MFAGLALFPCILFNVHSCSLWQLLLQFKLKQEQNEHAVAKIALNDLRRSQGEAARLKRILEKERKQTQLHQQLSLNIRWGLCRVLLLLLVLFMLKPAKWKRNYTRTLHLVVVLAVLAAVHLQ